MITEVIHTGMWLDFPDEDRNLVEDEEHKGVVAELHQKVLDYNSGNLSAM